MTPSAVSQYLSKKRAGKLKQPADYSKLLKGAVDEIMDNGSDEALSVTICKCCAKSRGGR